MMTKIYQNRYIHYTLYPFLIIYIVAVVTGSVKSNTNTSALIIWPNVPLPPLTVDKTTNNKPNYGLFY